MHPTGGSLRVFRQFAWLEVGSGKMTLSRPTHQRVTPTVRCYMRCEVFVHANTQCRKKVCYIAVSWEGLLVRYVCADHLPKGAEAHLLAPNTASTRQGVGVALSSNDVDVTPCG